jgi:hypothetical protein
MSTTQRLRVLLIGALGVIIAVAGFASPATAAPYTHHPTTSVSNSHPVAGSTITFCGAGFKPGEQVSITIGHTSYSSVTASSGGVWCTRIALSPKLSGNVKLTATSTTTHRSSSTRIHIVKRDGGGHGNNGWGHGNNGWGHGNNGWGHGNTARALALTVPGGPNSIAGVLGLTVPGGSNWIARVLARA